MVWMHIRDRAGGCDGRRTTPSGSLRAFRRRVIGARSHSCPTTVGTIEQVADAVRAYEAVGVDELLIQMHEPYDFADARAAARELRAALE